MIRVQQEDFDPGAELARLSATSVGAGAVCLFIGLVRDLNNGQAVTAMTLEHYPGMAERMLARLETEARARWALTEVLVVHRFGRLAAGDRIVLTACAAAHREVAFEACRFLIDQLKTRAPFWKAEETPQGSRWVEACARDETASMRWNR
jgi:molybdopterin synthase catalytic subunit